MNLPRSGRGALYALAVCALAVSAQGCGDSLSVVTGRLDATTAQDVPQDTTPPPPDEPSPGDATPPPDVSMDAVVPDGGPDVPVDAGPSRCTGDDMCAGNEFRMRTCDVTTGRCVQCLAARDACPTGEYCDPAASTCVRGCRNDDACRMMASADAGVPDGGVTPGGRCNPMSHTCVDCVTDEHCPTGQRCVGNVCVMGCTDSSRCPSGQQCCMGGCIDTQSNVANCGMCGNACSVPNAEPRCVMGACAVGECVGARRDCDMMAANGCETDTLSDLMHCGGCGRVCPSPANARATCAMGACGFTCNEGFADCDMMAENGCEVDLRTTAAHCGMCGNACRVTNGTPACVMSRCAVAACEAGFGDCDMMPDNGCETNVRTSTMHCGMCGAACMAPSNATAGCSMGACGVGTCNEGFADCDGASMNGCEVNTRTDPANCGACGMACRVANATAGCGMGRCTVAACNEGFADCDMDPSNGCEVDTRTSTAHCGRCNNTCTTAGGTAACAMGACAVGSCTAPRADCDRMAGNGCEVDTSSDVMNCGECGNACRIANGTAACAAGRCAVGMCNAGFADCDMDPSNGCEVDTRTSTGNCGRCGNACTVANGSAVCTAGACGVGMCNAGFADCDMMVSNGCETATATDIRACGRCGNVCPTPPSGTPVCRAGTCAIGTCASGTDDCDMNTSNGCETRTATDVNNCGACGRRCPALPNATVSCTGGVCGIAACLPGFADCNGRSDDGCEVSLLTSTGNCGRCGNACSVANGTPVCAAGACGIAACNAGFANCDMMVSNGCEVDTRSEEAHCGACGRACTAPTGGSVACVSSACVQSCPAGQSNCGGVCRATGAGCTSAGSGGCQNTGTVVCSGTSTACSALPRVTGTCTSPSGGVCDPSGSCVCSSGQTNCGGTCRSLTVDTNNCGACGRVCTAPTGGSVVCAAGACVQSCPAGQSNCGGVCRPTGAACTSSGTGGCASAGTFVCSGTSTACSASPRTSGACTSPVGGTCDASGNCVCPSGTANCSGTCVNLTSDVRNCGACGNACSSVQACAAGVCVGAGALRFTLTWSRAGDEDLHVVTPGGCHIYFSATSGCGGSLDRDDTSATGPENIFFTSPARGTYTICAVPWRITPPTSWTVNVVQGTTTVRTFSGTHSASSATTACPGGFSVGTYVY